MADTTNSARSKTSRTLTCVDRSDPFTTPPVRVDLLGPLRLFVGDYEVTVPALRPRALLGLLAIRANTVVRSDRLIDELWDGVVPPGAAVTLRSYISVLRRAFTARVPAPTRFSRPQRRGTASTSTPTTSMPIGCVVSWPRGTSTSAGLARKRHSAPSSRRSACGVASRSPSSATTQSPRRSGPRCPRCVRAATDGRLRALVEAGRHHEAIPALESLIRTEPLREEPYELLVLAFHRAGRTPEALEVHRTVSGSAARAAGHRPEPRVRRSAVGDPHPGPAARSSQPGRCARSRWSRRAGTTTRRPTSSRAP